MATIARIKIVKNLKGKIKTITLQGGRYGN